jgi:hypothetical protein
LILIKFLRIPYLTNPKFINTLKNTKSNKKKILSLSLQLISTIYKSILNNIQHFYFVLMVEFTGWFTKLGGSMIENWKRRYAILNFHVGTLNYYKNASDVSVTPPLGVVIIRDSKVTAIEKSEKKRDFCFCITHKGKQYYAAAETQDDYDEWMKVLTEVSTGSKRYVGPGMIEIIRNKFYRSDEG